MSTEKKQSKFISQYGPKKLGANAFSPEMDTTDQRAPINEISELWNAYMDAEDVMDELEAEKLSDFDDDVYEYEDISELGEDVLTVSQPVIADAGKKLKRKK